MSELTQDGYLFYYYTPELSSGFATTSCEETVEYACTKNGGALHSGQGSQYCTMLSHNNQYGTLATCPYTAGVTYDPNRTFKGDSGGFSGSTGGTTQYVELRSESLTALTSNDYIDIVVYAGLLAFAVGWGFGALNKMIRKVGG